MASLSAFIRVGSLAAALLTPLAAAKAEETIDPAKYRLVFDEEFATLSLRVPSNPDGRWDTKFHFGGRTLSNNGEMEIYVDPDYLGLGLNPFSLAKDGLTIRADPADGELKTKLGGLSYVSGLITTQHSFFQTYGYFEIKARLPAGKGLWPAFWLLPENRSWPPEIDVFEVLGDHPDVLYMTIHSTTVATIGFQAKVPDLSQAFHTYGVLWGREHIAWYLDGREMARAPTPADLHVPMYVLINLAVGGGWPGAPDSSTRFPADFDIAYVKAYATPETIASPLSAEGGSHGE